MKIALIQFQSHQDLDGNLKRMEDIFVKAADTGAELVVFPEMAYFTAPTEQAIATTKHFDETLQKFSNWAKTKKCALVPGTLREPARSGKYFNTLPFIDNSGKVLAKYRKLFLFRATLPHKTYEENKHCEAGGEPVVVDFKGWKIGLSICFDIRFPELFRKLKKQGAEAVLLPAAFTVPTGQAHWEVLTRARAIENQFFFLASAMCGKMGDNASTYGHSVAVSPWGEIMGGLKDSEGVLTIELAKEALAQARARVDAIGCMREDLLWQL